jgi:hypothetical protein
MDTHGSRVTGRTTSWVDLEHHVRDLQRALKSAREAAAVAEQRAAVAEDSARRAWHVAAGGGRWPADPSAPR